MFRRTYQWIQRVVAWGRNQDNAVVLNWCPSAIIGRAISHWGFWTRLVCDSDLFHVISIHVRFLHRAMSRTGICSVGWVRVKGNMCLQLLQSTMTQQHREQTNRPSIIRYIYNAYYMKISHVTQSKSDCELSYLEGESDGRNSMMPSAHIVAQQHIYIADCSTADCIVIFNYCALF